MSLTIGIGPLARPTKGELNGDIWSALPAHALYAHPEPRRIRGSCDGTTVLETDRAVMLHETGLLPVWYLPVDEDEQVHGHPTDPFHRVDVRASSRHVVVSAGDTVLGDSTAPFALFETGLPTRFYLPESDIDTELLSESRTKTVCPYKGEASYWNAAGLPDVCWSYPEPHDEVRAAAGLRCFSGDGITTTVDGVEI